MSLSDSLQSMREFDLGDLDFNNAGAWPGPVKFIAALLIAITILTLVYFLSIQELDRQLEGAKAEEITLRQTFQSKAEQVANLDEYKAQMEEMRQTFGALLQQLPSKTEVPGLLEDISSVGSQAGLDIRSIELGQERTREFYVELPIQISVAGGYHDLAAFVSGVAGLPRIVTLHDFSITSAQREGGAVERLTMNITARTYRYSGGTE